MVMLLKKASTLYKYYRRVVVIWNVNRSRAVRLGVAYGIE
jgi:hypothetical protein